MLDPKLLRNDLDKVITNLARRGFDFPAKEYKALELSRKKLQVRAEDLRADRNAQSKVIGKAKAAGEDIAPLLQNAEKLGVDLDSVDTELNQLQVELNTLLMEAPNLLDESVPDGKDETCNQEERRWGDIVDLNFNALDHVDLAEALNMLDSAKATKISGARFTVLYKDLARLQRALIQFMLDLHTTEHGYTEVYVPYIVNANSLFGTGQLPKFADDLFALKGEQDFYLIPTAEVPVTNLFQDSILDSDSMPQSFVAHTPCFRSEAGSYGKDTRGLIRQHQFEKVELVHVVKPEDSWATLELLVTHAESVLKQLELPYRVVTLCSGDTGFGAAKTYDLEVWLPSQKAYREISSCSNFLDFQARRMQARWRNKSSGKNEHVHTLNGSGVAAGRALVAILENGQQSDGSIALPSILHQYMGGQETIPAK
ncbi:MAG: serine--tRNA ligase [Pseudomonadota bacterium]|nr:serine--tRNA ligase [Pseudomonadota bacterium]